MVPYNLLQLLILAITVILLILLAFSSILSLFRGKTFPKKLMLTTLISTVLLIGMAAYSTFFYTFNEGEKIVYQKQPSVTSPTGAYTANTYFMNVGGAAGGVNIFTEVTFHEEDNRRQIVYYADANQSFILEWVDDHTLSVVNEYPGFSEDSRNIELEVGREIYHESGDACHSLLLHNEFETCYEHVPSE